MQKCLFYTIISGIRISLFFLKGGFPLNNQTPKRKPTGSTGTTQKKPASGSARPTGTKPTGNARPTANGARPAGTKPAASTGARKPATGARPSQPQRGKKRKIGKDGILAIIMLLLVVVLAAVIIICCVKAIADTIGGPSTTTGTGGTTGSSALKDPVYSTPKEGDWNYGFVTIDRLKASVNEGDLIVVNNDYEYKFPSSINLVEMWGKPGHNTNFVLGNGMTYPSGAKSLELSKHIVTPITTMLADMKAANSTLTDTRRLLILSGYRTLEKQQDLYEKETVDGLTAKPGHSEHHTGLTFDIRINVKNQANIEYLNAAEQAWIVQNCSKYGFILRYTDEKKDITGILNEDWHFRYVGVAHSTYMVEHDLCLEEYIAFLKDKHSYGVNAPLNYSAEGKDYTIYYFPASVEKDITNVYVPATGHYEVSGDNMNGFIVTITNESN